MGWRFRVDVSREFSCQNAGWTSRERLPSPELGTGRGCASTPTPMGIRSPLGSRGIKRDWVSSDSGGKGGPDGVALRELVPTSELS